jgi:hypothetical protein
MCLKSCAFGQKSFRIHSIASHAPWNVNQKWHFYKSKHINKSVDNKSKHINMRREGPVRINALREDFQDDQF